MIYTANSHPSTPKRQRNLYSVITSPMFLLIMNSVTWFFHDFCGLLFSAYRVVSTKNNNSYCYYYFETKVQVK